MPGRPIPAAGAACAAANCSSTATPATSSAAVMRRGLIAVGGRVGAFAAAGMVAGSLFVFGPVGANPGPG